MQLIAVAPATSPYNDTPNNRSSFVTSEGATTIYGGNAGRNAMPIPTNGAPWSERDLLVVYASLSMGTSIVDIAAALNRSVDEVAREGDVPEIPAERLRHRGPP
jgi:hypothetical protein